MLVTEDRGRVRWVTLDRPERKNAIPPDGWDELRTAFEDFDTSQQRCLVLTGRNGNFCSGADLAVEELDELEDSSMAEAAMRGPGSAALALHAVNKPVIAAVDGVAVGAGMNLALGCDIVVATPQARFGEIFVKRGLAIDFGGSWLLPRSVGRAQAFDLAMTGRVVDGDEALALGLVSRVVPAERLENDVATIAEQLAAGPQEALRSIKRLLGTGAALTFREAIAAENAAQMVHLGSADFREGVRAFAEKRDPKFSPE